MTTKTKSKPHNASTAKAARESSPNAPRPGSKIARVIALLEREQGATLDELTKTTGWQPHSARAALTGLKKKGHAITKARRDDVTCYRIEGKA